MQNAGQFTDIVCIVENRGTQIDIVTIGKSFANLIQCFTDDTFLQCSIQSGAAGVISNDLDVRIDAMHCLCNRTADMSKADKADFFWNHNVPSFITLLFKNYDSYGSPVQRTLLP